MATIHEQILEQYKEHCYNYTEIKKMLTNLSCDTNIRDYVDSKAKAKNLSIDIVAGGIIINKLFGSGYVVRKSRLEELMEALELNYNLVILMDQAKNMYLPYD